MPDRTAIPAPRGLKTRGKRFWKQVVSTYQLRVDELILLESASKTLDTLDRLEAEMAGQPLTSKGSMGQEREHPLLSEARQQRSYLNACLKQLGLPDTASAGGSVNQQRAAAQSRWSAAHGKAGRA